MSEGLFTVGNATVIVEHEGRERDPDFDGYRQKYRFEITTPQWQYAGNDIGSGVGRPVDIAEAARTLFGFLAACAESRDYAQSTGRSTENASLFPEHVGLWAQVHVHELTMLSEEPEY